MADSDTRTSGALGTVVCFGIPALAMAGSYAWLAFDFGVIGVWTTPVHESGNYKLGGTILYWRHFLREVPTVVAMALFLLAGWAAAGGAEVYRPKSRARAVRVAWLGLIGAIALIGLAMERAASSLGWTEVFRELLQYRTRDDLQSYGSHWHFHWLSTIWFGVTALLCARWVAGFYGAHTDRRPQHPVTCGAGWVYFAIVSAIFGFSSEPFVDARYAGHQAREIMTHGPVTLLLGLGVLHACGSRLAGGRAPSGPTPALFALGRTQVVWLVLIFAIPTFLAVVTLSEDLDEIGQTQAGLSPMVAAHFFEHTIDYAVVSLLVLAGGSALLANHHRS